MDNSYISLSSDEILAAIEKASLFGGQVSYPTASRNETLNIERITVDNDGRITMSLNGEIVMEERWPVSVMLNYRDISFQLDPKHYSIQDKTIQGTLPEKARGLRKRHDERYILPQQSSVTTTMYRIEKRGGSLELNLKVLDVSNSGLAVLVQDLKEENVLLKNDHLWVKSINGLQLEQPIFAKVVYVSQRNYKDTIDLKAGLQLQETLPGAVMRELQSLCNLVLTA